MVNLIVDPAYLALFRPMQAIPEAVPPDPVHIKRSIGVMAAVRPDVCL